MLRFTTPQSGGAPGVAAPTAERHQQNTDGKAPLPAFFSLDKMKIQMYSVTQKFSQLEKGMHVLWNGKEHPVEEKSESHAVIGGQELSAGKINNWLLSECMPFEIVSPTHI